MSEYINWEFLLDGHMQEFRQMSTERGTDYFNVYGGIDDLHDCKNDDFRMTTIYCADETEPEVVWGIGRELVSLYNGASIIFNKNYRKVTIEALWHNGRSVEWFPPSTKMGLLGTPTFSSYRTKNEIERLQKSDFKLLLLYLATEHKDIYFLLKYFDMEAGWVTYYKILEAIESLAKENSINITVNIQQRKFFTNTANNFSLSGFDSRHGFKQAIKENKTPSMTIEDGYKFVKELTIQYIDRALEKLTGQNTTT